MGIGKAMKKQTRDSDIILQCLNETKDISNIQNEIQVNLDDKYQIIKKSLEKDRIKKVVVKVIQYRR